MQVEARLRALAAVAVAALAVSPSHTEWLRPLRGPLEGLRALHSGHVGDYVAWLTAGVSVIGSLFALTLL
jgi:multicomponent Na+:H+ antiporter subunit D